MWLSGLHVHWLAAYDRVERNRPFEMLLDPQVNANTLTLAADAGGVKNPSVSGLTLVEPSAVFCRSYAGASTGWDGVSWPA